jgi:hypothetical protein
MAVCGACPIFERQVLTMRNAMQQWRNYQDVADDLTQARPTRKGS